MNMRRLMQVLGVLLIVVGVWRLLRYSDWWVFTMFTAFGVSQQINPKQSKAARRLRDALVLTTLMLAIIRIAIMLLGW